MAIQIIFAPPKVGKTLNMVCVANTIAFDRERTKLMRKELIKLIENGFTKIKTIPPHCVSANFNMNLRRYGYSPRINRFINPFRLGQDNKYVKTHYNIPYEAIFITEGQKYFNSRMSLYYPDWQSRWFEQHGHLYMDVFIDTQRPMLIDSNIRELASLKEIISYTRSFNRLGQFLKIEFKTRFIPDSFSFDKYLASGKKDTSCFEERIETYYFDAYSMYDCRSCKPKFYAGHLLEDIDYKVSTGFEDTFDSYVKFLENNDDEYVKGFYQPRNIKSKEKQ